MANLTLSIDDKLLARGRAYAQARGTSLNALVRQLLAETTASPENATGEIIDRLKASTGNSGGNRIDREDLHRF